jgi:hypothetical protein
MWKKIFKPVVAFSHLFARGQGHKNLSVLWRPTIFSQFQNRDNHRGHARLRVNRTASVNVTVLDCWLVGLERMTGGRRDYIEMGVEQQSFRPLTKSEVQIVAMPLHCESPTRDIVCQKIRNRSLLMAQRRESNKVTEQ